MFDNNRYITRGIQSEIPSFLQVLIWQIIDELKEKKQKIDYLQIFKVRISSHYLCIEQSSSCPKYTKTYEFGVVDVVNIQEWTIWVMDDGVQSLMMFPEEP